jgi:cardiolipin synthase
MRWASASPRRSSARPARGVAVRILLDGVRIARAAPGFPPRARAAGVRVQLFRPARSWISLERSRLRRLHRKIVVVDGRVAFVGGLNVIDDRTGNPTPGGRLDYACAWRARSSSASMPPCIGCGGSWPHSRPAAASRASGSRPDATPGRRNRRRLRAPRQPAPPPRHRGDVPARHPRRAPRGRHRLRLLPSRMARAARAHGGRSPRRARGAPAAGVHRPPGAAAGEPRALRGAPGARHRDLRVPGGELHAKVGVVDERWATVGSSNLDPFSLVLAREANVVSSTRRSRASCAPRSSSSFATAPSRCAGMLWRRRRWPARLVAGSRTPTRGWPSASRDSGRGCSCWIFARLPEKGRAR